MGFGLNIGGFASGVESGVGAYSELQHGQLEKQRAALEGKKFDLESVLADYNITALKNNQKRYQARQQFDTAAGIQDYAKRLESSGGDPGYIQKLRNMAHQHTQQGLTISFSDSLPPGTQDVGAAPIGGTGKYALTANVGGKQHIATDKGWVPQPGPGEPAPDATPIGTDLRTINKHAFVAKIVAQKGDAHFAPDEAATERPQAQEIPATGVESAMTPAPDAGLTAPAEPTDGTTPPTDSAASPASGDGGLGLPQATSSELPAADLTGQSAAPSFAGPDAAAPSAGGLPSDSQTPVTAGAGADSAAPTDVPQPTAPPAAAASAQGAAGVPQKAVAYNDPYDDPEFIKAITPLNESMEDAAQRHKYEYLGKSRSGTRDPYTVYQELIDSGIDPQTAGAYAFKTGELSAGIRGQSAEKVANIRAGSSTQNATIRAKAMVQSAEMRALTPNMQYKVLVGEGIPEDVALDAAFGKLGVAKQEAGNVGRESVANINQEGATGRTQLQETGKNTRLTQQIGATSDLQTQKDAAAYAREQLKAGGKDSSDKAINTVLKQAQAIREAAKTPKLDADGKPVTDDQGKTIYDYTLSLKQAVEAASQTYNVLEQSVGSKSTPPASAQPTVSPKSVPTANKGKGMLEGVMPKPQDPARIVALYKQHVAAEPAKKAAFDAILKQQGIDPASVK